MVSGGEVSWLVVGAAIWKQVCLSHQAVIVMEMYDAANAKYYSDDDVATHPH